MITIEELYTRAKSGGKLYSGYKSGLSEEDEKEDIKKNKMDNWRPYEITEDNLPEFNIPVSKAKGAESKQRKKFSKILTFIDYAKRKRLNCGCTAMPIPTTSMLNLAIWGSSMNISRAVETMKEIGLISVYYETYRFGVPYKGANYGKTYAYYKENEEKFICYCKENNIEKYIIMNVEPVNDVKYTSIIQTAGQHRNFEKRDVDFSSKIEFCKRTDESSTAFTNYLYACLLLNHPELEYFQHIADEINEKYYKDYPEFAIRFRPRYTWSEDGTTVTKIGIRATNSYCNKSKEERSKLLEQYGLNLEKDVRSSVPRLTLSLNSKKWIDESIDIYELINNEFEPGAEFTEARREAIKEFHMRVYFDKGSDKWLGRNIYAGIDKEGIDKTELDELIGRLRTATIKAEGGKTYGSEIFYIESCIYLLTLYDLLEAGYMTWMVYDAFYAKGNVEQETFETFVKERVEHNYYSFLRFMKVISEKNKLVWGSYLVE